MKTKDWVFVVAALLITIILDQVTKQLSLNMKEIWLGPVHLILIFNEGAMLGLFAKLPAFLRIVTLSTSGFFILSLYAFFQYIIPVKIMNLRLGLSLLVGGIIGNVLDRTYYGYVIDFIGFKIGNFHSPVWNVADMIQWVGYALVIYSIFTQGHELWPDQDTRKRFWVNKTFQLRYASVFMTAGLLISTICMVFSYTYLKISLVQLGLQNTLSVNQYTESFLYSFVVLNLTFAITLFLFARIASQKIAGPVYAFERFLSEALESNQLNDEIKTLKLRAGDEFKHLEELAEKIKAKILDIQKQNDVFNSENPDHDSVSDRKEN